MCWGVSALSDLGEEPQEPQSMTKYSEVKRERPWTDRTEQYASKEECLKRNKSKRNIHARFEGLQKNQNKVSQNLDDLQSLLIKLTVKASSGKAWLLYGFPFSLNPDDKPNDPQA